MMMIKVDYNMHSLYYTDYRRHHRQQPESKQVYVTKPNYVCVSVREFSWWTNFETKGE